MPDGITEDEMWALRYLADLAGQDLSLGQTISGYPWVLDNITEDERWSLRFLHDLTVHSLQLGTSTAEFVWLADNLEEHERNALQNLAALAYWNLPAALGVTDYPWLADGITDAEWDALGGLASLAETDTSLAGQLAAMTFLASSFEVRDKDALWSIFSLNESAANLALLTEQDWFQDGLDDEEAAFVSVLADLAERSPDEFRAMVDAHYTQSRSLSLPLTGDVDLIAFRLTPFPGHSNIMDQVEDAIRAFEDLMDVPFPRREVILLFVNPMYEWPAVNTFVSARHVGTHMLVTREEVIEGDYRHTVPHEVAHYYWGYENAPVWFAEGGADFLTSYALDQSGWRSLSNRRTDVWNDDVRWCNLRGIEYIQQLIDLLALDGYAAHAATPQFLCNYALGEYLMLNLYQTMGPEASSDAWNELFLLAKGENRELTEDEIYQAFLRNTPAGQVDEFRSLYDQWHGGELGE